MSDSLQSEGSNNDGTQTASEAAWKSLAKEVAQSWELNDEKEPREELWPQSSTPAEPQVQKP